MPPLYFWWNAIFSGSFAGIIAIIITVGIERFGGLIGGIIGSVPGTLVPASIGIWNQCNGNTSRFRTSMFSALIGFATGTPLLPQSWSLQGRLFSMIVISFSCWFLLASVLLYVVHSLHSLFYTEVFGLMAASFTLVLGVIVTWKPPPTPSSSSPFTSTKVLVARGFFAFLAVFVSVILSLVNDSIAGVAAVFPAVFSTTMIAVWISAGESVQVGAVGPMMLGTCSGSAYAILCGIFIPLWGIILGIISAWLLAVILVTSPAFFWTRWRVQKNTYDGYDLTVSNASEEKEMAEKKATHL
eukprot:jgi/Galph1/765/GphlegSOOS_G5551.1